MKRRARRSWVSAGATPRGHTPFAAYTARTMLYLLSPAKSLDYETPVPAAIAKKATEPAFVEQAAQLIRRLAPLAPREVGRLMSLSDELAALNVARYAAWSTVADLANSRPAVFAFDGDVYVGLQARTLGAADLNWAQRHLVILSGLYGALRPLDRLQPYRLEMGTRLANPRGNDLYAFWRDTLAQHLNERQAGERAPVVVNLASQEYFRAVDRGALRARVIDCVFEDSKAGRWQVIGFYAKRARGLMARWAVQHRVANPKKLAGFDVGGYAFDAAASAPDRLVFRRPGS
jgi:cytoplasmic iron level regulating protein YaaA (DUF328/UPF0246 family)